MTALHLFVTKDAYANGLLLVAQQDSSSESIARTTSGRTTAACTAAKC